MTDLLRMPPTGTRRAVVVGGSLAGLRAAEGLRKGGFTGELVVIDEEVHPPYNRPPLSKGVHQNGGLSAESLALRMPRALADVTWLLGRTVVQAQLDERLLRLDDGTELGYDGLVCATGLAARRLPAETVGGGANGRHVIRTLEDAEGLFAGIEEHGSLVVVGAGFLGCEVATVARAAGASVTIVAPEDVPMQRPLGLTVGGLLLERHRAAGSDVRMGRHIRSLTVEGGTNVFELDDGSVLHAPVVLEAIGGVPAVSWLDGNHLDLTNGVLADACLRVEGRPEVVVCGDLARWPNLAFDDVPRRVEHWTLASEGGRAAGAALAAGLRGDIPDPFAPVPSFWSDQLGVRIQSFGSPGIADGDARIVEGHPEGEFVAAYHREGRLVGVVLVGLPTRMGHYRELVAAELARV